MPLRSPFFHQQVSRTAVNWGVLFILSMHFGSTATSTGTMYRLLDFTDHKAMDANYTEQLVPDTEGVKH